MSECPWRGQGLGKELSRSRELTVRTLVLPLIHMGFSLPLDLNPGSGDRAGPGDDPGQIAQPRDQEEFPLQEVMASLQMPPRSHFKYFPKPSVLQVEACVLEKIFGECAGIFIILFIYFRER